MHTYSFGVIWFTTKKRYFALGACSALRGRMFMKFWFWICLVASQIGGAV